MEERISQASSKKISYIYLSRKLRLKIDKTTNTVILHIVDKNNNILDDNFDSIMKKIREHPDN
jgi:hypothetical protein